MSGTTNSGSLKKTCSDSAWLALCLMALLRLLPSSQSKPAIRERPIMAVYCPNIQPGQPPDSNSRQPDRRCAKARSWRTAVPCAHDRRPGGGPGSWRCRRRAGSGPSGRGRGGHGPARTGRHGPPCQALPRARGRGSSSPGRRRSGRFPHPIPEAGDAFLMFPRPSEQRAAVPLHRSIRKASMASVMKTSDRWFLPWPKLCPKLQPSRVPVPGTSRSRSPVPHAAAPHDGHAVSRTGGRPAARENLRTLPFVPVSPHPGMSVFRPKFASSAGRPRSRSKRCTMPVFPSRLSQACFVPLASNQPDGGPWSPGFAPGTGGSPSPLTQHDVRAAGRQPVPGAGRPPVCGRSRRRSPASRLKAFRSQSFLLLPSSFRIGSGAGGNAPAWSGRTVAAPSA